MHPFSWPGSQGRGMKNSLMSVVGLLLFSLSLFRLSLSSISIIDGSFCNTGTAAWDGVGFNFFDFGVRSWPSISVLSSEVMVWAWGLLVVATGWSGKGDEPTSEFVGVNVSVGVDDPWAVAELGGTVWVRLGTKSLASSIYFAGRHMVQAGQVDIAMWWFRRWHRGWIDRREQYGRGGSVKRIFWFRWRSRRQRFALGTRYVGLNVARERALLSLV